MKSVHFSIALLVLLFFAFCKSPQKPTQKETIQSQSSIEQDSPPSAEELEFTKAKEGFLSDSLFQVAVSSVATDSESRKEEARNVAEQKALNLLKTLCPPNLSERGKKELREISKEGKLVDKNVSVGNRYFFLYQIQKKDLKRLVTTQLE